MDMNIGTVAKKSDVPPKTIRYYESIGLIRPADRSPNGYRRYGDGDVQILQFIQRARSLGFSVDDVANLLALWRDKSRTSAEVKLLSLKRIDQVDRKIRELKSLKGTLIEVVERCHGNERSHCPIVDQLGGMTEVFRASEHASATILTEPISGSSARSRCPVATVGRSRQRGTY
jgi:MerR family copper efflux transcriptional regulator